MSSKEPKCFEIRMRNEQNQEFSVRFTASDEPAEAIDSLLRIKGAIEKRETIMRIRKLCHTKDNRVFFPEDDTNLQKARWIAVAAAASCPSGVPLNEIVSRTGLTPEKVSAYCTGKNNPTSRYLYREDTAVFIRPEGIDWLFSLLRKDKQIKEETVDEENSFGKD